MIEETKYCQTCGQKVRKLNPHRIDSQKVAMLELLAKARISGSEWVKALEGGTCVINGNTVRAPYLARVHANRLLWFDLAEHGDPRSGLYRATDNGIRFLMGKFFVPASIYCRNGAVIERSEEMINVMQVRGVVLDKPYWDNYWTIQKYPKKPPDQPDLFT